MSASAKFILLHASCIMRRPRNWRFHTAGIVREIRRIEQRVSGTSDSDAPAWTRPARGLVPASMK